VVVGSSPTSGANFIGVFANNHPSDTLPTQNTAEFDTADVKKWPKQIKHRNKVLAKIYRPGKGRSSYRVAWQAGGKRLMKSFPTYSGENGAKKFADDLVPSIAKGSQATLLTPKQAQDAFHIQDMLIAYQQESGRQISPVEAVAAFISASKLLPAAASLTEAARLYARTLGSVKPKTIVDAVTDFIQFRKGKDAKPGERSRFSPVYARNVESWLTKFSAAFIRNGTRACMRLGGDKGRMGHQPKFHFAIFQKDFHRSSAPDQSETTRNGRPNLDYCCTAR